MSLAALIAFLVPVSLLAAVSPVVFLNASTIAANDGSSGSDRFLGGNALVLVVIGLLAMGLLGDGVAAFTERELASGVVDGVLGALLLGYGAYLWHGRASKQPPQTTESAQMDQAQQHGLVAWGALGMATNLTSLPLYVAMAQHIGVARIGLVLQLVLLALVTAVVLTPAWLPMVLRRVAPRRSRVSEHTRARIARWTQAASVGACVLGGLVLLGHAALVSL